MNLVLKARSFIVAMVEDLIGCWSSAAVREKEMEAVEIMIAVSRLLSLLLIYSDSNGSSSNGGYSD